MRSIVPVIDFRFPGIAEDVARLRRLLHEALRLIGRSAKPVPNLLNLACGRADETGVLLESLSLPGGGYYLGLDLRQAEIAEATKRWRGSGHGLDAMEFRVADAALAHHWPKDERFDLIFIRHQNYWDAPVVWDQIFRHALARIAEDGLLLFTSYFDREHELAMAALQTRGAHLLLDLPHPSSRALADAPGKSVDKRLAIFCATTPELNQASPKILCL